MTEPPLPPGEPTQQQRNWAMLAHLSGLACMVPFGNVIGPLLIWQIKRVELGEFVSANAREALNFQMTFVIAVAFCMSIYCIPLPVIAPIGLFLIPIIVLLNVVMCVIATIRTNLGIVYRYPFVLRVF